MVAFVGGGQPASFGMPIKHITIPGNNRVERVNWPPRIESQFDGGYDRGRCGEPHAQLHIQTKSSN